jgi:hypothetical protein
MSNGQRFRKLNPSVPYFSHIASLPLNGSIIQAV